MAENFTMRPIRILLADDHALVRAGFSALLKKLPGIEVIAEAADGFVVGAADTTHARRPERGTDAIIQAPGNRPQPPQPGEGKFEKRAGNHRR